jgi:hypothetical protein
MTRPDQELIAQVLLFSKGFRTAETLASKVVPFFNLCAEQLSAQPHYDFGLRALKAVLASAGILKRDRHAKSAGEQAVSEQVAEQQIMIQSVTETIVPKLVADDVPLLKALVSSLCKTNSVVFFKMFSLISSTRLSILMRSRRRSQRSVRNGTWFAEMPGWTRSCSFTRSRTSRTA